MKGKVYLEYENEDTNVVLFSSDLIVYLDYERAKAKYVLDPSTLEASHSISGWKLPDEPIVIESQYNLGFIPTTYHDPKQFEGIITLSSGEDEISTESSASLRYLYNKWYSGLLKSSFEVDAQDVGLDETFGEKGEVKILISHPILHSQA